jgi:hypothetical protein
MKTTLLLFALLVTAGAAFAQCDATHTSNCIGNATDIIFCEEGTNILIIIGLTIFLIAAAYAAGSALGNANYIVFAKDEAYHLGFSIVILIAFSGILVFCCMLMDFFYAETFSSLGATKCYHAGASVNSVSTCYIRAMKSDATRLSSEYIKQHIAKLMDSTFMWSMQWPLLDAYSLTAGAYKRIISNQYDVILNTFLVPALMSVSMQKLILNFISENMVRWILPAAFLLRVFIPTRQMGNIMIAVVVGLYVVVPFMYAFNLSMYEVTLNDCAPFSQAVCDDTVDGYDCGPNNTACSNEFGFWNVARLIPQAFFLPNLTIAILVTFLGCMHKALRVIG